MKKNKTKNPLIKRVPRELKGDWSKYLLVSLFMIFVIGCIAGMYVANESMLTAATENTKKSICEDGHFELSKKAKKGTFDSLSATIYEDFYYNLNEDKDGDGKKEGTIRVFQKNDEVNLASVLDGKLPENKNEIAIDRMYADNNDLQVGDVISVDKKELTVTGLVALSDYSALFSNSSDMMFDAVKFGVGIMTEEGYDAITDDHIKYCYSWKYDTEPKDENEEKEWSDNFVEVLAAHSSLTGYLPRYGNQAIKFTGDDMGGDKAMVEVLLYILIAIMAFIFAVTTNNTIVKEASVIGTLRASGYTRRELLLHYLSPVSYTHLTLPTILRV